MYKRPSDDELSKAQRNGRSFQKFGPGGYVIVITGAQDMEQYNSLFITYEVCEGDFYHESQRRMEKGWKPLGFFCDYGEKKQWMIANFIRSVEDTNHCHINDSTICKDLINKGLGLVLQNYTGKDGKTRLRPAYFTTADVIRNGEFEVPPDKTATGVSTAPAAPQFSEYDADDEELPF